MVNTKANNQQKEIKKFTDIAQDWWDIDGKFAILHKINPIRLEFILEQIENDNNIRIGNNNTYHCTGPRLHVRNTGDIENFRLESEYVYDPKDGVYLLIGRVGKGIDVEY